MEQQELDEKQHQAESNVHTTHQNDDETATEKQRQKRHTTLIDKQETGLSSPQT